MRPTRKASPSSKAQINPADNPDDAKFYIDCDELARNGHFSYLMNFLGATLLHGYTHYDNMIKAVLGQETIDQPDGYGPVNVYKYNNLEKTKALKNSDSYMYYASEASGRFFATRKDLVPRGRASMMRIWIARTRFASLRGERF